MLAPDTPVRPIQLHHVFGHRLAGGAARLGAEGLRYLSSFHYYIGGEPLKNGMRWADAGAMLGISAVLITAGLIWFNRRDINS
ncbi:hypothetical protein OG589_13730 [Sphaerisporangium sp. NBC_01403]|uniref:hypothetical protein n=1 Tax=Sphaerisporangium sp. NBC_01403 TaxID=2903599 RepID=UPI003244DE19